MPPTPGEIYQVSLRWGDSTDSRPCLILDEPRDGEVLVALFSGQMDLYEQWPSDFIIEDDHPDFPATGLARTCYAAGSTLDSIAVAELGRRRGNLQGDLAADFARWIALII